MAVLDFSVPNTSILPWIQTSLPNRNMQQMFISQYLYNFPLEFNSITFN